MEKMKKVRLPSKKNINFVAVSEKKINPKLLVLSLILISIVAIALAKFFVIDRFAAVYRAESEVASLRAQLDDGYDKIASYGDIADLYAHYTYSEMSPDELSMVDRAKVLDLLDRVVAAKSTIDQWIVADNTLKVFVSAPTLQKVNEIAQDLFEEPVVTYVSVKQSQTENDRLNKAVDNVYAQITVYLAEPEEGETAE